VSLSISEFFWVLYRTIFRLWLPEFLGIWESVCSNPSWEQVSLFVDYVYRFLRGFLEHDLYFLLCRFLQYWIHRLETLDSAGMTYFVHIHFDNFIFSVRFLHACWRIYHFRWVLFQWFQRKNLMQYIMLQHWSWRCWVMEVRVFSTYEIYLRRSKVFIIHQTQVIFNKI
jgi:hypothetical protein